jgi:hypothetical protein
MSILAFNTYKEKFERLVTDKTISKKNFDSSIEDLVSHTPLGAMQLKDTPFLIRTSVLDKSEICTNVSRCSYVPDSIRDRIPLQRCNFERQQVFYASIPGGMVNFHDGAQPSLLETAMQRIIDDPTFDLREAAASRWRIKTQPMFWYLPHYEDSINKNKNFEFLYNHFDSYLKSNSKTNEVYQNFKEKLNYLSGLFCRNHDREKTYKVTAAYYNKVMNIYKRFNCNFDALIYPSANTRGEGMNIVLTKDYVDINNIYCDLVVLYIIKRHTNNPKSIGFMPYAQALPDENGNLDFKPLDYEAI